MANGRRTRTFRNSFLEDLVGDLPDARRVEPAGTTSNVQEPLFEVPGGDGARGPAERRRRLLEERGQLRIDTGEIERPSFDAEQSRLNRIITGVGALGSLALALGGSEIGAAAGAGLAQGGARNLRRQRESFRRRREAFRKKLQTARTWNREVALSTNEARHRGAEALIERKEERAAEKRAHRRERELMKLRERLDQKLSPSAKKRVQKELDLLDAEIEAERALAKERRRDAREGTRGTDNSVQSPDTVGETEAKIEELIRREQRLHDQGATSGQLRDVQERIVQLKRHRDVLRRRQEVAADSAGAAADTSRVDTTRSGVPADTTGAGPTSADTIDYAVPQDGAMMGGGGGGGTSEPTEDIMQLEAVPGGSSSLGARSTAQLVEDALTVAWHIGPEEAERRLDALVKGGQLSERKRDSVVARMRRQREAMTGEVHGKAPAAVILEDAAAVDSLDGRMARAVAGQLQRHVGRSGALRAIEQASKAGQLSDSQANALRDAVEQRDHSRQKGQVEGAEVTDREIQRAVELVEEGAFTAREFAQTYGLTLEEARQ